MDGKSSRAAGQVMGLVRYATKHGGISSREVKAILCLNVDTVSACLRDLTSRGKVRRLPNGNYVALPPKAGDS